jgi:hypothetical protein
MPEIATYADYFIGGAGQLPIILATLGVLAGLAAVGRLMYGGKGFSEADLFGGWAMAVFVFTIGNIFFRIPFNYLFWVMAAIAAGAALWLLVRERLVGASGFWRALILIAPLLLIASARMASEWDEFSHWLPTERFIFNAQGFPFGGRALAGGHFPGYPYAWLLLLYMANMLAGQLVEAAGSVMNILLLLVFGIGAVRLWNEATDRPMPPVAVLGWTGALFAVAAATVLNPTFVQKVVMTTYADPSTAASVGVGTVLAYFILDALVSKDPAKARTLAWQFGFVMAVLINIKQSNLVLVVMLLGGVSLVALRDPAIRLSALIRLLPAMMVPAVLIYLIWRYHVGVNLPGGVEASFQPYEKWNLDLLWPIMQRMLLIASKKLGYFAVMGVAVFFALRGLWRCETRFDRLAMLIGFSFLGYNAFLYLIFVTHFSEYDALRAASYWRYNHHLGLMAVAFGAFGLGTLWRRYMVARPLPRLVLGVLCAVVLLAPFVFAEKLRFDLEHPKPFYRTVGHELPGLMPVGSRLLILDPSGTGESGVLTQFEMAERQNEFLGYRAQYHGFAKSSLIEVFEATKPTHLLVHSFHPTINEVLGTDLPEKGFSFLLRKTDDDPAAWVIVKKWPRSDSHWDGR